MLLGLTSLIIFFRLIFSLLIFLFSYFLFSSFLFSSFIFSYTPGPGVRRTREHSRRPPEQSNGQR